MMYLRFAGLAGARIHKLSDESCTVFIKKRLRVTNHIGGMVVVEVESFRAFVNQSCLHMSIC